MLRHNDATWDARVIGSIVGYSLTADDPEAVIENLSDPRIRIVSITATEGGYNIDPLTGRFDAANELVAADLRRDAAPRTMFGLVIEALARRRARSHRAFTVLSCDNIQGNGHVAEHAFASFARLRDPDLASWITDNVRFPNSMVDRITPQTTDEDRAELSRRFGIEDRWPVLCEPLSQWVLEESFSCGRPPLEEVGAKIVSDVAPYELMKLRMLNAGHQALCYPGYLVGYRLVHEVIAFWARYAEGVDEQSYRYAIDDALEPHLRAAAARQQHDPVAFLEDNRSLFGELVDNTIFTSLDLALLRSIHERGVRATLADLDGYEHGAGSHSGQPNTPVRDDGDRPAPSADDAWPPQRLSPHWRSTR